MSVTIVSDEVVNLKITPQRESFVEQDRELTFTVVIPAPVDFALGLSIAIATPETMELSTYGINGDDGTVSCRVLYNGKVHCWGSLRVPILCHRFLGVIQPFVV